MIPPKNKVSSVVMLGMVNTSFLEPTAESIKFVNPELDLGVAGLFELKSKGGREIQQENEFFDRCYPSLSWDRIKRKAAVRKKVSRIVQFDPNQKSAEAKQRRVSNDSKIIKRLVSTPLKIAFTYLKGRSLLNKTREIAAGYDLLHLIGIFMDSEGLVFLNQVGKPYVVTCVGSDILRTDDPVVLMNQRIVLNGAAAITVTNHELKEIVLAKYGRHLESKMHIAFFKQDVETLCSGDRAKAEIEFKAKHNIATNSLVVCVGHNGHFYNGHLEMLDSIAELPKATRERIHLVVPMTYGGTDDYREAVTLALDEVGLDSTLLFEYMDSAELESFRLATDILIHAPISDAFSGTVTQCLAAGSAVITGSWLPYSTRKRIGLKFWEIDERAQAGNTLGMLVDAWDELPAYKERNQKISAEFFGMQNIGKGWVSVYESAL